jgi:trehalose 6-phosphate synthase
VIVVSNRVPAARSGRPQAGGLAVALDRVLRGRGGVWFGWSGETAEPPAAEPRVHESRNVTYAVVDLGREDFDEYYNGFSNRTLWPLMHYRLDLTEFARRDLASYLRVNRRFAEALRALVTPDALIWVHDYHLIPLARELRAFGFANRIGYFHHIPWPAPDVLTALPRHHDLVRAMLAYDLVGMQTAADCDNLLAYLAREFGRRPSGAGLIGEGGVVTRVQPFPIGIETRSFARRASRAVKAAFVREFEQSLHGRALIIGVDRLDYSKGVAERMQAFETFLSAAPEYRNRVTYLQVTPRSRSEVPEYAEIERAVGEAAGRINGAFGEANWTPIRYVNRPYSRTALAGLYRRARVGLVTPFRDGMNLVAKEYVAAQDPKDPGVLVLSRFAGAAAELDAALIVNPYDTEGVAYAIRAALEMPLEERRARWAKAMRRLSQNDVDGWAERFLGVLEEDPGALTAWLSDVTAPDAWRRPAAPTPRAGA